MTICSVYVGDLGNPNFKWDGGDWNGNVPSAISPEFPPPPRHYNGDYHAWVKRSGVECKQTDFDGYVARVKKAQILDFVSSTYARSKDLPWVKPYLPELLEFIDALDDDAIYALVATSF